jgi:hypothetical protein
MGTFTSLLYGVYLLAWLTVKHMEGSSFIALGSPHALVASSNRTHLFVLLEINKKPRPFDKARICPSPCLELGFILPIA